MPHLSCILVLASLMIGVTGNLVAQTCRLQSVGTHALNACTSGREGPVVVFEAGAQATALSWRGLMGAIGTFARVMAYDRAGVGRSQDGPLPRTPATIASELAVLLDSLALPGPYLLVGHSIGGLYVRQFAEQFPERTAGLILLDTPHERFEAERDALSSSTDREERAASRAAMREGVREGVRREYEGLDEGWDRSRPLPALGSIPLFVLSADRHSWAPARNASLLENVWQRLQREMSRMSREGRYRLLDETGHNIPRERPLEVVRAVRVVLGLIATSEGS